MTGAYKGIFYIISDETTEISIHTIHNRGKIKVRDWSEDAISSAGIQVMVNTVIDGQL